MTLLPNELGRISKELLSWVQEKGMWQELLSYWSQETNAIRSLPLFFSGVYKFFIEEMYPDLSCKDTSLSLREAIGDFSSGAEMSTNTKIVGDMAENLLASFGDWTQDLPDQIRLAYQLHLEGLLNTEIAEVLGENESEIQTKIKDAKDLLLKAGNEAV